MNDTFYTVWIEVNAPTRRIARDACKQRGATEVRVKKLRGQDRYQAIGNVDSGNVVPPQFMILFAGAEAMDVAHGADTLFLETTLYFDKVRISYHFSLWREDEAGK